MIYGSLGSSLLAPEVISAIWTPKLRGYPSRFCDRARLGSCQVLHNPFLHTLPKEAALAHLDCLRLRKHRAQGTFGSLVRIKPHGSFVDIQVRPQAASVCVHLLCEQVSGRSALLNAANGSIAML